MNAKKLQNKLIWFRRIFFEDELYIASPLRVDSIMILIFLKDLSYLKMFLIFHDSKSTEWINIIKLIGQNSLQTARQAAKIIAFLPALFTSMGQWSKINSPKENFFLAILLHKTISSISLVFFWWKKFLFDLMQRKHTLSASDFYLFLPQNASQWNFPLIHIKISNVSLSPPSLGQYPGIQ